jgi:hypothetical protein
VTIPAEIGPPLVNALTSESVSVDRPRHASAWELPLKIMMQPFPIAVFTAATQ